jgi:hypothetical protein
MTDRTLTPEVYGDFGLFLEQVAQRPKDIENTKTTPQFKEYPKAETSDFNTHEKEKLS